MNATRLRHHLSQYAVYWIAGLALLLRLLYLLDISGNPLFYDLSLDRASYDQWAQKIAAGDWIGKEVFYQTPLYPYFLAVIYAVFGRRLLLVYVIQAVLGALDCIIIYGIGKESFDRRVGILAGLAAALYKMFFYYQVMILKTFLEVLLVDLALYLALRGRRGARPALLSGLSGLVLGLACLTRETFLVTIPLFLVWLWMTQAQAEKTKRIAVAAAFAIFAALPLGASLLRNLVVGHDFVLITAQGGQNFYIGNHRQNFYGAYHAPGFVRANPAFEQSDFRDEARRRTGRKDLKPSELSSFWYGQALEEIAADPGLYPIRMVYKILLLFGSAEVSDNISYQFFREKFSLVLKLPLLIFGVVCPLGLMGLLIALRERKARLLAGFLGLYCVSALLYFIFGRYRLVLVPALLVFGSYFALRVYDRFLSRDYRGLMWYLPGLIVLAGITNIPLEKTNYADAYFNLGNTYVRLGQPREAINCYQEAIARQPNNSLFLIALGQTQEQVHDLGSALISLRRAVNADPQYPPAYLALGEVYLRRHEYEPALAQFRIVRNIDPENVTAMLGSAKALEELNLPAQAQELYEKVLTIDPANAAAQKHGGRR